MGATYKLKRKTGANTTEEVLFPIASVDGLQTALNGKLGTSAKAADSSKLNGQAPSYYLNYTNLTNKPTIPTATSQLTNDSGFLTTETYKGTVTSVKVGTTSYTPSSGVVSLPAYPTVPTQTSQLTNNSDFATNASVDTKIANLVNSAPEALDTLGELATALQTHEDAYDALLTTVGGKVDKVSGKGLSTNDYTTAEKNKLAGIASGAEVNVQSDWSVTDSTSDAFIKNKPSVVNVNQYYTTTNNNYPLLFKALAGNTSTSSQLGSTRFVNNVYVNPSTGTVYANDFVVDGKSIVGGGGGGGSPVRKISSGNINEIEIDASTLGAYFRVLCYIDGADELYINENSFSLDSDYFYTVSIEGNLFEIGSVNGARLYYWNITVMLQGEGEDALRYSFLFTTTDTYFYIGDTGQSTNNHCRYSGTICD